MILTVRRPFWLLMVSVLLLVLFAIAVWTSPVLLAHFPHHLASWMTIGPSSPTRCPGCSG